MAANEIHLDDIGTVFEITVMDGDDVVDISEATTKEIIFRKPDGSKVTQTADFITDGSDGEIQYVSVEDDLDQAGAWHIQSYLVLPDDWTGHSDVGDFKVHKNL